MLVASICWYRRTTDGLFFIAPVLIQLAWKFEIYKKYDLSFALWKKEKKTLREFGYARAISSILCPNLVKDRSENDYAVHMVWQAIFVILILHIYVFVVIIIHAINPKLINPIFIYINSYFDFIFNNWPSYMRVENGLIVHGYEDKIPIIKNVYLSSIVGTIFIYLYFIINFFKLKSIKEFMAIMIINFKYTIKCKNPSRFIYYLYAIYNFIIYLIGSFLLILFLYYYASIPILYPGESPLRHGLYLWMASYAYKDEISLFTPTYIIIVPSFFILGVIMVSISIVYSVYSKTIKWIRKPIIK